jgi:hypothetical protein
VSEGQQSPLRIEISPGFCHSSFSDSPGSHAAEFGLPEFDPVYKAPAPVPKYSDQSGCRRNPVLVNRPRMGCAPRR